MSLGEMEDYITMSHASKGAVPQEAQGGERGAGPGEETSSVLELSLVECKPSRFLGTMMMGIPPRDVLTGVE